LLFLGPLFCRKEIRLRFESAQYFVSLAVMLFRHNGISNGAPASTLASARSGSAQEVHADLLLQVLHLPAQRLINP